MDTSSSDTREQIQRAIDDEIKALEKSIRASKYHRNALAPILQPPSEILAMIFSFLSSDSSYAFREGAGYRDLLHATHVCRHWREIALSYPHLWSRIDFNKLTKAAISEILARAKLAPLHFQADPHFWSQHQSDFFENQVEVHSSHMRLLSLTGVPQRMLERLVLPAPVLESLILSSITRPLHWPVQIAIHDTLFNSTAPKLANLVLVHCDISWKSPLLKGLRTLHITKPSQEAVPTLEDWLDTLNEMTQLQTLILYFASPTSSLVDPRLSGPRRIVTLPSLTQFGISSSAADCALALSHLMLPALTSLRVDAKSYDTEGSDVGPLIPHIARNAHGPQDTEPLQSIAIRGGIKPVEILAWTSPDADVEDCNRTTVLRSERVFFTVTAAADIRWPHKTDTGILDTLLMQLPTDAISTLSVEGYAQPSKEFWLNRASSLAMLKRARLASSSVKAFREALAEDSPPNGPRFPRLKQLILVNFPLTALRTYHLHDVFIKRMEQGAPLEALDLRTCTGTERAIELLAETVSNVQGPVNTLEIGDPAFFDWKGGVDFFDEEEKRADEDESKFEPDPWDYSTTEDEDEDDDGVEDEDEDEGEDEDEDDDEWDEYDEDSDPYYDDS